MSIVSAVEPIEALAICFAVLGLLVVMVFYFIVRQRPSASPTETEAAWQGLDDLEDADLEVLELYDDGEVISDAALAREDPFTQQDRLVQRTAKVRHRPTGEVRLARVLVIEDT